MNRKGGGVNPPVQGEGQVSLKLNWNTQLAPPAGGSVGRLVSYVEKHGLRLGLGFYLETLSIVTGDDVQ